VRLRKKKEHKYETRAESAFQVGVTSNEDSPSAKLALSFFQSPSQATITPAAAATASCSYARSRPVCVLNAKKQCETRQCLGAR